ncbi:hypothetical protein EX30DRAFT_342634 [Ascodesmis nigricans]|uniref:Uncharacterized protein n=1 Tax=Ascodesmis nigricans TaxID=341454 RepID=A0A4S2MPP2_9PEZI|nr:hypothetical protein EX30DRAFT_342634 [Ascodesmis nigricans]
MKMNRTCSEIYRGPHTCTFVSILVAMITLLGLVHGGTLLPGSQIAPVRQAPVGTAMVDMEPCGYPFTGSLSFYLVPITGYRTVYVLFFIGVRFEMPIMIATEYSASGLEVFAAKGYSGGPVAVKYPAQAAGSMSGVLVLDMPYVSKLVIFNIITWPPRAAPSISFATLNLKYYRT